MVRRRMELRKAEKRNVARTRSWKSALLRSQLSQELYFSCHILVDVNSTSKGPILYGWHWPRKTVLRLWRLLGPITLSQMYVCDRLSLDQIVESQGELLCLGCWNTLGESWAIEIKSRYLQSECFPLFGPRTLVSWFSITGGNIFLGMVEDHIEIWEFVDIWTCMFNILILLGTQITDNEAP